MKPLTWLFSLLLLFTSCCGPAEVQKEKVVDTVIRMPGHSLALRTEPSVSYADTVKGNLTLRIKKSGKAQYKDTVEAITRQYKQRIRQLTDKPCPGIQDALLLEATWHQRRIQQLRDSLVTIRASVQQKADSIRVVKSQTLSQQQDDDSGAWLVWVLWGVIFFLTGIGFSVFYTPVKEEQDGQ